MRRKILWSAARIVATTIALLSFAQVSAAAGSLVSYDGGYPPGTIVVHTQERRLYLVLSADLSLSYTVGVGRTGWQWAGTTYIDGKYVRPNWAPPPEIRLEQPNLPAVIPAGSPANPMGAAAMTLAGGAFAIHGTNAPELIGGFVSHGCIRMFNDDIIDLFGRVAVGTTVVVTP